MKRAKKCLLLLAANTFGLGMVYFLSNPQLFNFPADVAKNVIHGEQFEKEAEAEYSCPPNKSQYKFQCYNVHKPEIFLMKDDNNTYFQNFLNATCFVEGTDWEKTLYYGQCKCLNDWFGDDCGIPAPVWFSLRTMGHHYPIARRRRPRRVLNALNINHELDFFEARIHELGNSVDVYLIGESNYSAFGEKKTLLFYERFRAGYLKDFQSKFVYVFQDHFPAGGKDDGWIADSYQRTFLTNQGLKQVRGLRDDDILLLSDADELPKREVITFLKLYDNYLDPIKLAFIWTVFKFYWSTVESPTEVMAASTIKTFKTYFKGDGARLRSNRVDYPTTDIKQEFNIQPWTIGVRHTLAGWHCSWCFINPEDIRIKLISAQNGDRPRWGDYPEKTDINYIKYLVRTGMWFDNQTYFVIRKPKRDYAPRFYLVNMERFRSLLHPYDDDFNLPAITVEDSLLSNLQNNLKENLTEFKTFNNNK